MYKILSMIVFLSTLLFSSELNDIQNIIKMYEEKGVELKKEEGNLYFLARDNTKLVDEDLAYLSSLENIIAVNINNTAITDKGISYLLNMKNLIRIDLGSTQITDSALGYISQLPNIEGLCLSSTKITNESLTNIFKLKKLRALNIFGTEIVLKDWPEVNVESLKLFSLNTPMEEIVGPENIKNNILLWSTGIAPVKSQYFVGDAEEFYRIQLDKGESWNPQNKGAILTEYRKR